MRIIHNKTIKAIIIKVPELIPDTVAIPFVPYKMKPNIGINT
jgi:hypothetical protein